MPDGWLPEPGIEYSTKLPDVVTRPILSAPGSVNQRLPSGPRVIERG